MNQEKIGSSPFLEAVSRGRRLKLLLWGETGAGKTTLSLQFPNPAVIDLEGGTEHYGESFDFHVLKATSADDINTAVEWLLTHDHNFCTLVVDPITQYWDALQRKWSEIFMRRNKGGKGHRLEYYDFQPRDWMTIKAEHKELVRNLIQLDMNVIVTARQKILYGDQGFMRAVGETFDGEKSLPYLFDTILQLYRDDKGRFMAKNLKDRTNKLPQGHFEINYQILEGFLGKESLGRRAVPIQQSTSEQIETLGQLIAASEMKEETVQRRLAAYGADSIESLTQNNAQKIIDKLNAAGVSSAEPDTSIKENSDA